MAALTAAATGAHAQGGRAISGTVVDSASGAPVTGAEVTLRDVRVVTSATGGFVLLAARTSSDTMRVRRLGFRSRLVPLDDASVVRVPLAAIPQQLSPVVVQARWGGYTGRLAGYYERLGRRTTGQFITRAELDAERSGLLTNLLQRMPGVQVRRGAGAPILSMRGRDCRPLVWIDGTAMPAGDVDLDSFSPSSLHGVELYLGAMSAPLKFQAVRGQSECGTVVLWSRGPDTDPVGARRSEPAEFERMIARQQLFTAEQVDRPAVVAGELIVSYPQELKAENVTGAITVEYIVDAGGHLEADSFGIVVASDPRFGDEVFAALRDATFTPALRQGKQVRQLVRQRFRFGMN